MKKFILGIFLLNLAIPCNLLASEVFLKKDVVVKGEYIMLGDIFAGIDASTDKKIASSPAPARQSHFDFQTLSTIARKNNINWQPMSDFESVSVTRSYQTITSDEIIEAIKSSKVFENVDLDGNEEFESRTLSDIDIADGIDYTVNVVQGEYNPKNNNFRVEINIKENGNVIHEARILGKMFKMLDVPVLRKSISSGMIISENDLEYIKIRSDSINQRAITDETSLIGKEAKRTLKPKALLSKNDVMTPVLVEKSKMVRVIFKKKNMMLSYVGKALEDGSMGDYIRFQAASGTDVLQGEVIDTNTVMVSANTTGTMTGKN